MNTNFNNKTILITGGAGFIGSNIAFYLQENYPDSKIIIFDIFRNEEIFSSGSLKSYGHYKNLIGFKGIIICGDITNDQDLNKLKNYKLDYIFHQAAISDTRVYDQELIMKTNVNSFYKLLEIAKNNNSTIVYASSAATYGSSPSPQKIGDDSPENPYAFSKYCMDQIAYKYLKEHSEMHIIGLKFFNVYGEKEYFKEKSSSMILQIGHQILAGKSPRLFFDSDKIMRDFIYIKDVVEANILACFAKKKGVYNVGTGINRSFYDIVSILQQELNTDLNIEYFKNPYTGYQMNTKADISLTQHSLKFKPSYTLEKGIKEYTPYIKQTFNWNNK
ncbi:ADP-glyceromanno-heptose 6-epimerase [Tenacibaculum retecalamus]|uniref:ADP-glyceromanno-heptose 6-epimerase n=1 Tax=Tenacibaculum retecalamus TaxID=3018315 RepID=UPI0023D8E880|nr:ADP-glyceromanno-heptose 6-epimerase [Tenacibaculum retecalamus]WBX71666.1 ADP-glyceromanno-heptose 6-epimerase [Tenacibaculum retecalamus]